MTTMTVNQAPRKTGSRNLLPGSIAWAARAINILETWRQRQKSRAQFAGLDARILKDSGISEAQRFIEGNKSFWEA